MKIKEEYLSMCKKTLFLAVLPIFLLCSCNQNENNFNNSLPSDQFEVHYVVDDVTNRVKMQCDFNIDSNDVDIFDSVDNDEIVNSIIGGDVLTVYYTDEDKNAVDHVLVSQVSLLPVTNHIVPGSDSYMQIHCDDYSIDQTGISYVINEDFSITYLSDLEMGMSLFGSYVPSNAKSDNTSIKLSYLFSFNPRS